MYGHHLAGDQRSSPAASDTGPDATAVHATPAVLFAGGAASDGSLASPSFSHPAPETAAAAPEQKAAQQPPGATDGAHGGSSSRPIVLPEQPSVGGAPPPRQLPLRLPRLPLDDAVGVHQRRRELRDDAVRAVSSLPSSPLQRATDAGLPKDPFAPSPPPRPAHFGGHPGGVYHGEGGGAVADVSGGRTLAVAEPSHLDPFEWLSEGPTVPRSELRHQGGLRGKRSDSPMLDPHGTEQRWDAGWGAPVAAAHGNAAFWQDGAFREGLFAPEAFSLRDASSGAAEPVRRFSDTYALAPATQHQRGFGLSALGDAPGLQGGAGGAQHHQHLPHRQVPGQSDAADMDTDVDQPRCLSHEGAELQRQHQQLTQAQALGALARQPSPHELAQHVEQAAASTGRRQAHAAEQYPRQFQQERSLVGAAGAEPGPRHGRARDMPSLTWASKQAKGAPGRANYSLFYLVPDDDGARAQLCAVGVDTRQSGHYVYSGVPTTWFPHMPSLSVTNTSKVRQWLEEGLGLTGSDCASYTAHENLPWYTEDEIRVKLGLMPTGLGGVLEESKRKSAHYASPERAGRDAHTSGDSVPAPKGPESLRLGWNFLEEHKEHLPDGRKRVVFTLVDSPQRTRVFNVVTADESRPNDRRYFYKANKEIGGYLFKNKSAAKEWINKHFLSPPALPESFARPTASVFETVPLRVASASDAAARDSMLTSASMEAEEFPVDLADLPAVEAAFQGESDLLQWAVATPAPPQLLQFELWAQQLRPIHCISAQQPPGMQPFTPEAARLQPDTSRWTSVEEAVHILQALSQAEVSLQLLERSGISSCIAHLRAHPDRRLADLARHLSESWGAKAQRSLQYATAALAAAPLSEARP